MCIFRLFHNIICLPSESLLPAFTALGVFENWGTYLPILQSTNIIQLNIDSCLFQNVYRLTFLSHAPKGNIINLSCRYIIFLWNDNLMPQHIGALRTHSNSLWSLIINNKKVIYLNDLHNFELRVYGCAKILFSFSIILINQAQCGFCHTRVSPLSHVLNFLNESKMRCNPRSI